MSLIFRPTMAWRTVRKAQKGRERPCDATVAFRCGAVLTTLCELIYYRPVSFPECCCAGLRIFSPVRAVHGALSFSPEIPKPRRRQFRIAHRVLDIPMPEISLQGSGVVSLIGKRLTAGVAQHVRMGLEQDALISRPVDHPGKSCGAKRRPAFQHEHEG